MLSLSHLRYFAKAAQLESIARAAGILHVTPSAISQAIVALERDLDASLTTHQRNRLVLTPAGKLLAEKAQALLVLAGSIRNDLQAAQGRERGELEFMTQQSIAATIVPQALARFGKRHPGIQASVQIGVREQVLEAIGKGTTPFGIMVGLGDERELASKALLTGDYVLVGRRGADPRAGPYLLSDLKTPEVDTLRGLYQGKYRQPLPVAMTLKSWSVCAEMAAAGLGIAFVPEYVVGRLSRQKLRVLPWPFKAARVPYAIKAVWRRDAELCACSQRFLATF